MGLKTIFGSFAVIVLFLITYNLFNKNKSAKIITFGLICGLITISSLIMLALALDTIVNVDTWL
jgi:fluoride ion exporter CrcB/FEX